MIFCLAVLFILTGLMAGRTDAEKKITKGDAAIAKRSAKSYIKLRVVDKAIDQLQVAITGNPNDVEAHFLLGELYSDKSRADEMKKEFDLVLADKKGKRKYGKKIQPYLTMWWQ
jgi:lipopolysaccharide biosynthesis regulator YciM